MNRLSTDDRVRVVSCLVEGNSIRATVRLTGIAKNTIAKLIEDLGFACMEHHDRVVRNVQSKRVQCDEIWSFVYAKDKNISPDGPKPDGIGSVWTWTALDADSKLMVSWLVGDRDARTARRFMHDVAGRLANRVQLTSDGHSAYLDAVEHAFGGDVDYAALVKLYGGEAKDGTPLKHGRYLGAQKESRIGSPDAKHGHTSYVERANLTMRMGMRRFIRRTNGFSKKIEKHALMVSIFFAYYNFCRRHQTLRCTPAMAAGLSDHTWSAEELVGLLEEQEAIAWLAAKNSN